MTAQYLNLRVVGFIAAALGPLLYIFLPVERTLIWLDMGSGQFADETTIIQWRPVWLLKPDTEVELSKDGMVTYKIISIRPGRDMVAQFSSYKPGIGTKVAAKALGLEVLAAAAIILFSGAFTRKREFNMRIAAIIAIVCIGISVFASPGLSARYKQKMGMSSFRNGAFSQNSEVEEIPVTVEFKPIWKWDPPKWQFLLVGAAVGCLIGVANCSSPRDTADPGAVATAENL